MESILTSIKKLLGIMEDCIDFDIDIIIHINSVFMILTQIGVGPEEGFAIKDKFSIWTDFVPEGYVESVKTYVYLRVKLLFDPPASSSVMESIKRQADEIEWRLNVAADKIKSDGEEEIQNG